MQGEQHPDHLRHISDAEESQLNNEPVPQARAPLSATLTQERDMFQLRSLEKIMHRLSPGERMLLYGLSILLVGSALVLLIDVNKIVSTTVPSHGGSLKEGSVGTPRFVNPLLAMSQTDQDLTSLIYSGLMRATPSGDLTPDLASGYEVSDDGTTYIFHIRPNATFHDGHAVTAKDVIFTVSLTQNQNIKSPRLADWDGVTVSESDEKTVVFQLPHAYGPFLENTQLGILPKHLWGLVPPEEFPFHALNTHPIGSGPYALTDVKTDDAGSPILYELSSFNKFTLGTPNLNSIIFRFYSNEEALRAGFVAGEIDSFAGVSPESDSLQERRDTRVVRTASTRIFGIFFNQNHATVLSDASVRAALSAAVDRDSLIDSVLGGFAKKAEGPIPPGLLQNSRSATTSSLPAATSTAQAGATSSQGTSNAEKARGILSRGGWKYDETSNSWTKNKQVLAFALATADTPELSATANAVAETWRNIGVDIDVQVYPLAEFNANVLRPRQYDAVLFGEVVGRTLDLFAFWHSSQRNDPGLNLALYTNTHADKLLASARTEVDRDAREELYRSFSKIIGDDQPAVFLYAPEFMYVVPQNLQGLSFGALTSPSERFLAVHQWYTDTERIWNIFSSNSVTE
ncbi:MAG: Extracellular solute-binding protein family 5 [Parcubacteria group bacterium Gr01-1014_8]|nr:MAG: Extracellular solute-binding protein family 5 [Parcubacteria group bacterium Gr01-1014_8]